MLSRWFEEASEAQSSRGTRPQTRPRGEASAGSTMIFFFLLNSGQIELKKFFFK